MSTHVLRSFLYLDKQTVDDYLSALNLDVQDEEVKAITKKSSSLSGEGNVSFVKGGGKTESEETTETSKQVTVSDAAKFQRLYSYLEQDESLSYYECLDDETWSGITRNSIIEVAVDLSLSKIGTLSDTASDMIQFAHMAESVTGQRLLDASALQAFKGIDMLAQMETAAGIPVLMSLLSSPEYKLVSYLNPDFLRIEKSRLVGQVSIFCKVQRKLAEREKYDLFNPLKALNASPRNRAQRRAKKDETKAEFPAEFRDTVKAPAAIVTPVAIYK